MTEGFFVNNIEVNEEKGSNPSIIHAGDILEIGDSISGNLYRVIACRINAKHSLLRFINLENGMVFMSIYTAGKGYPLQKFNRQNIPSQFTARILRNCDIEITPQIAGEIDE